VAESVDMDSETLTATLGSVAKWRAIANGTAYNHGSQDCPLCHRFNKWHLRTGRDCDGCPVKAATGLDGCHGTPLTDFEEAEEGSEEAADAAQRELDFLILLLPEGVSPDLTPPEAPCPSPAPP
jgi:hypothetical protein